MTTPIAQATGLGALSKALQTLHRTLLMFQADEVGFSGTPLQLFDRATKDIAFAWLKPLREAIVALDERRAEDRPITRQEIDAIKARLQDVIGSKPGALRQRLNVAFQAHPETVWAIGEARRSLNALR